MKKHLLAFAVVAGLACVNAGVANADSGQGPVAAQLGYFTALFTGKKTSSGASVGAFGGGLAGALLGPVGMFVGVCIGAV